MAIEIKKDTLTLFVSLICILMTFLDSKETREGDTDNDLVVLWSGEKLQIWQNT